MKRFIVQGALLLGLALLGTDAFAQGAARGKVLDEAGVGVPDAQVLIEFQGGVTRKITSKTNKKGEFTQVGLPPGNYKFTITKDGYRPDIFLARVGLGEATELPVSKLTKGSAAGAGAPAGDPAAEAFRTAYQKAIDDAKAGQTDVAIASLRDLIAKNPGRSELWEVHLNLGKLLAAKQDWAAAEPEIKKSLELRPNDNSSAQLALADVYNRSGQKEKADALLTQAASAGGDASVQMNLGIAHLNAGRSAEAEAAFRKTIEMDANAAEAHFHLATILVGQGKTPEAIAALEKYLTLKPTVPQNEATAKGLLAALKPK
jgi:tetratricopeptide (TPR) repeat protein